MHTRGTKSLAALLPGAALLGGLAVSVSARADIVWTGVYVQQNYFQDANGVVPYSSSNGLPPAPGWDWNAVLGGNAKIDFSLATTAQAEGERATVSLPGSSTQLPLAPDSNWHDPYYHVDYFGAGYNTLKDLFAAYPGGTYLFTAPNVGIPPQTQTGTLNLYANALLICPETADSTPRPVSSAIPTARSIGRRRPRTISRSSTHVLRRERAPARARVTSSITECR